MRPQRQGAIPNVIFVLLIANGILFALQQLSPEFLIINFALWPATTPGSPFMPWQLVTYGFLHGNLTHIFFNMFALWMFGRELELLMGQKRFLTYYFTCVVATDRCGRARRFVPDARRLRWRIRHIAGLRHGIPEPHGHVGISTNSHEGQVFRIVLWFA